MAISTELSNSLFEQFWLAGMRKINKKKCKPLFNRLLKESGNPEEFTRTLINDIQLRLKIKQYGFDGLHPQTYLNGERWEDEVVNDEKSRFNANSQSNKETVQSRVEDAGAAYLRSREAQTQGYAEAMESVSPDIRINVCNPVRNSSNRLMGATIDGDYTRSNS